MGVHRALRLIAKPKVLKEGAAACASTGLSGLIPFPSLGLTPWGAVCHEQGAPFSEGGGGCGGGAGGGEEKGLTPTDHLR